MQDNLKLESDNEIYQNIESDLYGSRLAVTEALVHIDQTLLNPESDYKLAIEKLIDKLNESLTYSNSLSLGLKKLKEPAISNFNTNL